MKLCTPLVLCIAAMPTLANTAEAQAAITSPAAVTDAPDTTTPAQWLAAQKKPVFRRGHTLPRLTRFGWTLPFEARVELARNWGYALEFGGYATMSAVEKAIAEPDSESGKAIALSAREPFKYPLFAICTRDFPKDVPADSWVRDQDGNFTDGKNVWNKDGAASDSGKLIWSPEAPRSVFEQAAALRAEPLKKLRDKAPIAIILNGGEYALGVAGAHQTQWEKDPRIVAAKGESSWFEYTSKRKALQEKIIADAVRAAVPDRNLYIYYNTGAEAHRNRYVGWDAWAFDFAQMRDASDLPSNELYYKSFNSGWAGDNDLLTQTANTIGYQIAHGAPLSYNWLCAGWPRGENGVLREGDISEMARYIGYLKCVYTMGQIGGNAGYYAYPTGGFAAQFAPDEPPPWLPQMTAFSHVHALWSWLERFSRQGELLPGPDMHKWSKDQPAYEFPSDTNARVVARKMKARNEWLITAWAAEGSAREVNVTLPQLGAVTVLARPAGSVYHATLQNNQPQLTLLDEEPLAPTADARTLANLKAL